MSKKPRAARGTPKPSPVPKLLSALLEACREYESATAAFMQSEFESDAIRMGAAIGRIAAISGALAGDFMHKSHIELAKGNLDD